MPVNAPQVLGLGQCSLDILGRVGRYPELDQKAELSELLIQGGGPVATALVTLARLGVPVAFVGAVGDDEYGRRIRDGLLDENVNCDNLVTEPGAVSQAAFISVDDAGHRNIFWHRGTACPEIPGTLPEQLSTARILHLDGLHLDVAVKAAEIARRAGVTTVLDAGTLRPGIESLLPLIDHFIVSEKFARQLVGRDEQQEALGKLSNYGSEAVTITLGGMGSLTSVAGEKFHQPAFAVDVVDTTGCGDVFHGGYIYGLLQDWPLRDTVRFASACAALKTRALGGRTAIPSLTVVEGFLKNS